GQHPGGGHLAADSQSHELDHEFALALGERRHPTPRAADGSASRPENLSRTARPARRSEPADRFRPPALAAEARPLLTNVGADDPEGAAMWRRVRIFNPRVLARA